MQNARDTFYMALRSRLASVNSLRTILIRGMERPGVIVEDAETPFGQMPNDVFVLRWNSLGVELESRLTLAVEGCEIFYQTSGSQSYGGLDRGRGGSGMDEEILEVLSPYSAQKYSYASTPAIAMGTYVFWSVPEFSSVNMVRDVISRTAKVSVYSYQEQGE